MARLLVFRDMCSHELLSVQWDKYLGEEGTLERARTIGKRTLEHEEAYERRFNTSTAVQAVALEVETGHSMAIIRQINNGSRLLNPKNTYAPLFLADIIC